MREAGLRLPNEFAKHLVVQLRDAARETGWESLLRDAEGLEGLLECSEPSGIPEPLDMGESKELLERCRRQVVLIAEAMAERMSRDGDMAGASGARQVARALRVWASPGVEGAAQAPGAAGHERGAL